MAKLSKSEKKVLASLITDGRMPYSKMARENKLTRQTVHNVIKRLYGNGVIQHFSVRLDTEKLGLDIKVYSMISLSSRKNMRKIEKTLSYMKEISQIHRVLGSHDYLLEISVPSRKALTSLFERIAEIPEVEKMDSMLVFETVKYRPSDPIRQLIS